MSKDKIEIFVTENRAATDESIRLATEFQQKALDSIIGTKRVEVNGVSGELIATKTHWNDEVVFYMVYNINGKRSTFKVSINGNEAYIESYSSNCTVRQAYMQIFAKKFSEYLAVSILDNLKLDFPSL